MLPGGLLNMDYYRVCENVFCVADGTTPDTINNRELGMVLRKFKESIKEGKSDKLKKIFFELVRTIPSIRGVQNASRICCDTFVDSAVDEKDLDDILWSISDNIKRLNDSRSKKINYLGQDFFGCAAAGGIIRDDNLIAFNNADAFIMVFDSDHNLLFRTEDRYHQTLRQRTEFINAKFKGGWENPKVRSEYRYRYRNNPSEENSYGTFTGEVLSLALTRTYTYNLSKAHIIIAGTDGCLELLDDNQILDKILEYNDPSKIESVLKRSPSESTMVLYKRI
jgi:hypothetical protein